MMKNSKAGATLLLAAFMVALPASGMAAPAVLQFSHTSEQESAFTVSGTTSFVIPFLGPTGFTSLQVPGFDSALGTLLSARLTIESHLASALVDHAVETFLLQAVIGHELEVTTGPWTPNDALSTIIANSSDPGFEINLRNYYSPSSASDTFIPLINVVPSVEVERRRVSSVSFDETFMGSELSPFIDVERLFFNTSIFYLDFLGYHESNFLGEVTAELLEFPTEVEPGSKPGIASALLAAIRLVNTLLEEGTGHGLSYSDMHVGANAQLGMTVEYTYEPARAVPEPGALAVYAVGLVGFGLLSRERRRRRR